MGKSEQLPPPRFTKPEEPFIPYVPDEKVLERLRPVVEQAEWVIPGHGAPIDGARALAVLEEDQRYLSDWELPDGRRTTAQREIDAINRERAA
jgi:hypothetical protein